MTGSGFSVLDPKATVGLADFGFEGVGDAGEDQTAAAGKTAGDVGGQVEEGGGEDIGNDERPGSLDIAGTGVEELEAVVKVVETGVLGGGCEGGWVKINGRGVTDTMEQGSKRQDRRAGADVEDAIDGFFGKGFEQGFQAKSRGGMMAAAEDFGVVEAEGLGRGGSAGRGDEESGDADGTGCEQPDGAAVARSCGGNGGVESGKGSGRHAVGEDGGEGRAFGCDVECAEIEKRVEGGGRGVDDVNTVRHSNAL